jgi:copper chaperone NosL
MLIPLHRLSLALLLSLLAWRSPLAQPPAYPLPAANDTCPVCGMFVAKYPEWIATVLYQDGHAHHFDGAKDLPRWAPGHRAQDIQAIGVTDYYTLGRIDARQAWYVIGADVLGPMGHELIPLASAAEAEEFLDDHQGRRILRFDDVTTTLLKALDGGKFD